MSLFRQIWLVIITSTTLLLISFFVVGIVIATDVLKAEQSQKNINAAQLLSLKFANVPKDPQSILANVRALAQSGEYDYLRLSDAKGKVMFTRQNDSAEQSIAPSWFVAWFPIDTPPALQVFREGQTTLAKLEVSKQRAPFYDALWNAILLMAAWMMGGMVMMGLLCNQVLRRMRKPIDSVIAQAKAINDREFNLIPVSKLPELRGVTLAMNDMVDRLKVMFANESKRLEDVRKEANIDRLTGLALREAFMAHLNIELTGAESAEAGTIMILRLSGLAEANRKLGRQATDLLMKATAECINEAAQGVDRAMAGRIGGTDLALLLPNETAASDIAQKILSTVSEKLDAEAQSCVYCQLASTLYRKKENQGELLSRLDLAIAEVEASGRHGLEDIASANSLPKLRSQDDWRKLFEQVIAQKAFKLEHFPVVDWQGKSIHDESPLRMKLLDTGEWVSAGSFVPMAIRLGQVARLDVFTLLIAVAAVKNRASVSITLSGRSLNNKAFNEYLVSLISKQPELAPAMWMEVTESDVYQNIEAFKPFCRLMKSMGVKVGIKQFGHRMDQATQLHSLGLHYFKVDSVFSDKIHENTANQAFMSGIASMAHSIGVKVIATGVRLKEEANQLQKLQFDGITGPWVKQPT